MLVLKNCPFCGNGAELVERIGGWTVTCKGYYPNTAMYGVLPCPWDSLMTCFYETPDEAVGIWNTRPIEDALQARIPQWISVKDRLPEDGDEVLFFVMDWVMKGKYCKQVPQWEAYLSGGSAHYHKNNGIEHVTHWMPLPELPEENK